MRISDWSSDVCSSDLGLFEVSMTLIGLVIKLAPYAVFCFMFNLAVLFGWELLVRLGAYVAVVFVALVLHTLVTYSLALKFIGGYSPVQFFKGDRESVVSGKGVLVRVNRGGGWYIKKK